MKITVYGTGTSGHQVVTSTLKSVLNKANISFELHEETDVSAFLNNKLSSIPAIQVDDDKVYPIKKNGAFNQSLRQFITDLLEKNNFGDLAQIILPIDFSDTASNAFYYGHRLASDLGAVLKVLHACMPHSSELSEAAVVDFNLQDTKKALLDDFVDRVDVEWGSDLMTAALITKEFRLGFPADEVIASAKENNVSMIVMGTTGEGGAMKKILGSVSTKVMKEAECNVLLVPPNVGYKKIKHILYASKDLSLDMTCIRKLTAMADVFQSTIHIVHVKTDNDGPTVDDLKAIMDTYPDLRFVAETIEGDNVVEELNIYADRHKIDLIALGTKNRGFFEGLFHKSISKELALHTTHPVIIVKS